MGRKGWKESEEKEQKNKITRVVSCIPRQQAVQAAMATTFCTMVSAWTNSTWCMVFISHCPINLDDICMVCLSKDLVHFMIVILLN